MKDAAKLNKLTQLESSVKQLKVLPSVKDT